MKNTIILLIFLFTANLGFSQAPESVILTNDYNGKKLPDAFELIEKQHDLDFFFMPEWIDSINVAFPTKGISLNDFLKSNLKHSGLNFTDYGSNIILLLSKEATLNKIIQTNSDVIIIGKPSAQSKGVVNISGTISDGSNEEPLIGALVEIKSLKAGAIADMSGGYQLKVPTGRYTIEAGFVGYEKKAFDVAIRSEGTFNIELFSGTMQLRELTVTAEGADYNVQNRISGVENLGIESIKQLPTFMGEIDPIKSLTTLPGVSTPGEASSGFNVRGGDSGENLILQDGAVIYNPSHLFGFFSAFNPDLVNNVTLHKGGGPAKFGGRTSSVLNINLRHGNLEEYKVSGGIGLISSRLTLEGPIAKNKTSFIIGGRGSYNNWLLRQVDDANIYNSSAQFYDVNAKIYHKISDKDQLTASFYYSDDEFKFAADTTFSWNTKNFSLEWNHIFNPSMIGSLTLANSNYQSSVDKKEGVDAFLYKNNISNNSLKYNSRYTVSSSNAIEFGIEGSFITLLPGELNPLEEVSNIEPKKLNEQRSLETAIFIDDEIDLSNKLAVSIGLRYSHFFRLGPDMAYLFDYDSNGESFITDSISYGTNDIIKDYGGLEPRASMRYLLSPSASLKLSYYRTRQYLHLISNTVSVTPQDYWMASGQNLQPQTGNQFSIGIFKNLKNNDYELNAEAYYKTLDNVVDYREGADIFLNKELEGDLLQGDGKAYGLELFMKKNAGYLTGWVSYTYSRSLRQFSNINPILEVNEGAYYPSNFDQPHNLSLILNYKFAARLVFSANFSYSTGRPVTVPVSKFSYDRVLSVLNYSERNEYRIPDYHRLDLSLTLKPSLRKKKFEGEWVLSVFNVYGRKNAYSVFFNQDGFAYQLSILGTVFPSLSYNFKF
ncbi:MAG: TonB-dependent receptor [Candidatus Cyclobacteriaceae bacterium M2_1C_046]